MSVHICTPEEVINTTVIDTWELPYECWELNLETLEEQPMLFIIEPSLQPQDFVFQRKRGKRPGMIVNTFNSNTQEQRQIDVCRSDDILVYRELQDSQRYKEKDRGWVGENPCFYKGRENIPANFKSVFSLKFLNNFFSLLNAWSETQ